MKAAVIVFPASNCDRDVKVALERTEGVEPVMVWHKETEIPKVDLIVLPGGFAFGDYLRCGAIAAHSPVMYEIRQRADKGVPILGICNGFQVLTEAGLLPGALLRNAGIKFLAKDVHLKVQTSQSLFTNKYESGQTVRIPIAHHDGNYFADQDTLNRLEDNGQIAFRYCTKDGEVTADANPNGAARNIAGIFNESKTILGLMPHPERLADPALGGCDGKALFDGIAEALS
ncbi:MAG TPA: phosphoribosylformylglycinamidine synthase subunit PurQ [Alphaproteobacteria bacterium]|nr:phosphoribosylformylglycinamidine synthase subunit PurQ [Alphaproteobacteria bacterium]